MAPSSKVPGFSLIMAMLSCASSVSAQPGPTNVAVAEAITRKVADGKVFVGSVNPSRTSVVGSAVDGRVLSLPVEAGDFVTSGQVLAQLRTKTIETELAAARGELELRRQELAELQSGSRPEEIAQAKARMLSNQARMENAKRNLQRVQKLYRNRSAAEDELDDAQSLAIETEQDFLESKAANDQVVFGPRKERIAQAAARVTIQTEEVHRLEDLVKKYTIVSPFDGFVTAKRTEVGEWVTRGQVVAEIADLTSVDVEVRVLEDYVARLSVGEIASVTIPSLSGRVFTGKIHRIVPLADPRSRSFPVRIRVPNGISNNTPVLMAGMFAQVTLGLGAPLETTLVPKDAIVLGGRSLVVYVVDLDAGNAEAGTVREVDISVGVATGELMAIRGKVNPKALVVVRGNERLRPGQHVTITSHVDTRELAQRRAPDNEWPQE